MGMAGLVRTQHVCLYIHTFIYDSGTLAVLSDIVASASRRETGAGGGRGGGAVTVAYQGGVGGSIRSHFLSVNCILCDTLSRSN